MKITKDKCFLCGINKGEFDIDNYNQREVKICAKCDDKYNIRSKAKDEETKTNTDYQKYFYITDYCCICKKETKIRIKKGNLEKYQCVECENNKRKRSKKND